MPDEARQRHDGSRVGRRRALGIALALLAACGAWARQPAGVDGARERAMPLGPIEPAAPATGAPGATTGRHAGETGIALVGVLGLAVGVYAVARYVARRRGGLAMALGAGGRSPEGVIEVLARYPVARGLTLVLLKLDRRVLLVSQASSRRGLSMTPLCDITDQDEVASILLRVREGEGESAASRFEQLVHAGDRAHAEAMRPSREPIAARASTALRGRLASWNARAGSLAAGGDA